MHSSRMRCFWYYQKFYFLSIFLYCKDFMCFEIFLPKEGFTASCEKHVGKSIKDVKRFDILGIEILSNQKNSTITDWYQWSWNSVEFRGFYLTAALNDTKQSPFTVSLLWGRKSESLQVRSNCQHVYIVTHRNERNPRKKTLYKQL